MVLYKPFNSKALRYGLCVTRDHTVLPAANKNHTYLYSPAARHHCRAAGTHCFYRQRDGQAELTWVDVLDGCCKV